MSVTGKSKKTINEWTSRDHAPSCPRARTLAKGQPVPPCAEAEGCCPADLVINASGQTVILGSLAKLPMEAHRIDTGDRRQGEVYVSQQVFGAGIGLARVRDLPFDRLVVLEKERQVRMGERPADWIIAARERSKKGEGPPAIEDGRSSMSSFARAAAGID